jgi:hypothetical protein
MTSRVDHPCKTELTNENRKETIASILRERRLLAHSRAIGLYDEDPPIRYHDRLFVTNERPYNEESGTRAWRIVKEG